NLAGNRAKNMRVASESGDFTYEYTKRTAHLNAFIALAPYWFPLFTIVVTLPAILSVIKIHLWFADHGLAVAIVGAAFGADLALNVRDISPLQSDFSVLRGGFRAGVLYVFFVNLTLFSILAAWVAQGPAGLIMLGKGWWQLMLGIVKLLRGTQTN